jgi:hypothetical protein
MMRVGYATAVPAQLAGLSRIRAGDADEMRTANTLLVTDDNIANFAGIVDGPGGEAPYSSALAGVASWPSLVCAFGTDHIRIGGLPREGFF